MTRTQKNGIRDIRAKEVEAVMRKLLVQCEFVKPSEPFRCHVTFGTWPTYNCGYCKPLLKQVRRMFWFDFVVDWFWIDTVHARGISTFGQYLVLSAFPETVSGHCDGAWRVATAHRADREVMWYHLVQYAGLTEMSVQCAEDAYQQCIRRYALALEGKDDLPF